MGDVLITGVFSVAVAVLAVFGPGWQRSISGRGRPDPSDWAGDVTTELADHERRLGRIERGTHHDD
jgi:hypothetical protein